MERVLLTNLEKPRLEEMHGRKYLVAKSTLIVPGVLAGSEGKLLYPPEEVGKDMGSWNGMPIVVYHPQDENGNYISARHPSVLRESQIGTLFNNEFTDKHEGETWFDVELTRSYDTKLKPEHRILPRLQKGEPIELSTGLFTENFPAEKGAVHNGVNGPQSYDAVARNYKPDHLAVLPDQLGACSNADGCGVNVNEQMCWGKPCDEDEEGDEDEADKAAKKGKEKEEEKPSEAAKAGSAEAKTRIAQQADRLASNREAVALILSLAVNERMCWGKPCGGGSTSTKGTAKEFNKFKEAHLKAGGKERDALKEFAKFKQASKATDAKASAATKAARSPERKADLKRATKLLAKKDAEAKIPVARLAPKKPVPVAKAAPTKAPAKSTPKSKSLADKAASVVSKIRSLFTRHSLGANMKRNEMIQYLTANCDCWKGKDDVAVLNKFTDDKLKKLVDNTKTVIVVNAVRNKKGALNADDAEAAGVDIAGLADFLGIATDPASDPVGFVNELQSKLSEVLDRLGGATPPAPAAAAATDDADEGAGMELMSEDANASAGNDPTAVQNARPARKATANAKPAKSQTTQQWLASAPPAIQSAVRNAMSIEKAERVKLVRKLVSNIADADQRQKMGTKLLSKSIDELRDLVDLLPVANTSDNDDVVDFRGAAGGPGGGFTLTDNEAADILDIESARATYEPTNNRKKAQA